MQTLTCEIVRLDEYDGSISRVYSIYIKEWDVVLFDRFLDENASFKPELISIDYRLKLMTSKYGVREQWLKLNEGPPELNIVAIFDEPKSHLRCYGIQFGKCLLIVGGGGKKPKNVRRFQEVKKLHFENFLIQQISRELNNLLKTGKIYWAENGIDLIGDLEFQITM
jgi:hypothetical protein